MRRLAMWLGDRAERMRLTRLRRDLRIWTGARSLVVQFLMLGVGMVQGAPIFYHPATAEPRWLRVLSGLSAIATLACAWGFARRRFRWMLRKDEVESDLAAAGEEA